MLGMLSSLEGKRLLYFPIFRILCFLCFLYWSAFREPFLSGVWGLSFALAPCWLCPSYCWLRVLIDIFISVCSCLARLLCNTNSEGCWEVAITVQEKWQDWSQVLSVARDRWMEKGMYMTTPACQLGHQVVDEGYLLCGRRSSSLLTCWVEVTSRTSM